MKSMKKILSVILACLLCVGIVSTAAFAATAYIGEEKAKEIALSAAGIPAQDAKFIICEFDYENGTAVYDVEFYYGRTEYSYDIDAVTGEILKVEQDRPDTNVSDPDAAYIGKAKAKEIAFAAAGVKEEDAKRVKVVFDFDDGRAEYEVEFHSGKYEYDYEIDAVSGEILRAEKDREFSLSGFSFFDLFARFIALLKSYFGK
ncbi:MAG: PepSY domain-containing protein [Oscillospiraceae bacterium]|nr:PepSY domain-containing protein [Oscillospiraceae bacterium]